jgi:hypothetical protein
MVSRCIHTKGHTDGREDDGKDDLANITRHKSARTVRTWNVIHPARGGSERGVLTKQ